MFYRTIRMVANGIKPVYVFDGKPPDMKSGELVKRSEKRYFIRHLLSWKVVFFHFYVSYLSKLKDEGFAYHSKIIFKKSRLAKIHHWSFLAVHKLNNNFRAEAEKALAEAKEKGEAADVDKFERRLVKASGLVEGGENMERVAGDEGTEWRGQEAAHSDGRACCRGALRGWGAVRCSCQKWEGSNNFSLI